MSKVCGFIGGAVLLLIFVSFWALVPVVFVMAFIDMPIATLGVSAFVFVLFCVFEGIK